MRGDTNDKLHPNISLEIFQKIGKKLFPLTNDKNKQWLFQICKCSDMLM